MFIDLDFDFLMMILIVLRHRNQFRRNLDVISVADCGSLSNVLS